MGWVMLKKVNVFMNGNPSQRKQPADQTATLPQAHCYFFLKKTKKVTWFC